MRHPCRAMTKQLVESFNPCKDVKVWRLLQEMWAQRRLRFGQSRGSGPAHPRLKSSPIVSSLSADSYIWMDNERTFSVVFVNSVIAPNTGNAIRLAAATGVTL